LFPFFLFEAAHRRCQYITSSAYTTPFNQSTRLQYAPTVGVDAPQLLSFPLFLGGGVAAAQMGVGAGFFRPRLARSLCGSVFFRLSAWSGLFALASHFMGEKYARAFDSKQQHLEYFKKN